MSTAIAMAVVIATIGWWMARNIRRNRDRFLKEHRVTAEMEARLKRLRKLDSLTTLLCLAAAVVFMFLFSTQVAPLKERHILSLPGTVHYLPYRGPLLAAGLLIGVCTVVLLDFIGWRVFLGKKGFALWADYGRMLFGLPVLTVLVIGWTVAATCCPIVTFLGLDCYVRVTDDEFVQNGFWTIGETPHAFGEVMSIKQTSFEHQGKRFPIFEIVFQDASAWRSQGWMKIPGEVYASDCREIVEHVSKRSSVPIR